MRSKLDFLPSWQLPSRLVLAASLLVWGAACSPAPPPSSAPLPPATASAAAVTTSAEPLDKEDVPPEADTGYRDVAGVTSGSIMVGAANPHAARAGFEMLRAGGSAVDAAVAMALVLTLVEPQSSGIGGGAFLLHWEAGTSTLTGYDGRETAPAAATPTQFLDSAGRPRAYRAAIVGGLSVGVPGELRMLELAHQKHGKLPWKQLFQPAISLAREGFAISPRLHQLLGLMPKLPQMMPAGRYFYQGGRAPKAVGTVLTNEPLAEVFEAVATGGAQAFYTGAIAADIVAAVAGDRRNPGKLALADLAAYQAVQRLPVCAPYRTVRVCGMPPPTSGGVAALQILGVLASFDLSAQGVGSVDAVHLFAEASRLAYADRDQYIADPDFIDVPVAALLAPAYLAERAKLVDPARTMGKAAPGRVDPRGALRWAPDASAELPSTTHLVVVDSAGNGVSMTASVESAFGSHLMVRGFMLNNELTDFSFRPTLAGKPVANRLAPGKRPRSSMTPMVVLTGDGKQLRLLVGSPGGSRIIDYVARVLVGVIDFGLDVQTAIARPNVVNRNGATELEQVVGFESWLQATQAGLEARGHQVKLRSQNSGIHAIERRADGSLSGGADPRREGLILGN